jgi:hypothetical protein
MDRAALLDELVEQARGVLDQPRFLADVRTTLEEHPTFVLQSFYSRNILPVLLRTLFPDFVSGAAEVPPAPDPPIK